MRNPSNSYLWMQEMKLQEEWNRRMQEHQIYWAQRVHQNWITIGDQNIKFFQVAATLRKRQYYIRKILDEHGILVGRPKLYLRVFSQEFKSASKMTQITTDIWLSPNQQISLMMIMRG